MRRTIFTVLATVFALAPAVRAAVSVQVVRVEESRVKELDPGAGQAASPGQVTLTLRLGGAEVAGATEYGRVKITEAADDTGASIKAEFSFSEDVFMPLHGAGFGGGRGATPPPEIHVSLAAPRRAATRIARVKGEVYVKAGGRPGVVTVPRVAERAGQRVDDPVLKAAKLVVTIVDPKAATPEGAAVPAGATGGDAVTVKIVGDESVVKRIDVVGQDGQSVSPGRSSSSSGNTAVHTLMLDRALDPSMSLKIEVLSGQKTVRVPLDLKDVPLP